jgi:DivIVA domain-containing protein
MFAVEVLVGVVVLVGVAFLASGAFDPMSDEAVDRRDTGLPADRPLTSDDVPRLRFGLAFRGYRMSDVDDAMQRVYDALRAAEAASADPPPPSPAARPEAAAGTLDAATVSAAPATPAVWSSPMPPIEPIEPVPAPPPAEPPLHPDPQPAPDPLPQPEPPVVPPVPPLTEVGDAVEQPPAEAESMPLSMLERLRHGDHDDL